MLTLNRRIIPNGLLLLVVVREAIVAFGVSVVVEELDADVEGRSIGCCFAIVSLSLLFPDSDDCLGNEGTRVPRVMWRCAFV